MNIDSKKNEKEQFTIPVVRRSNLVWVVENINGDIIGVADSFAKALLIYEERYQDAPDRTEDRIHKYELNRLYYA